MAAAMLPALSYRAALTALPIAERNNTKGQSKCPLLYHYHGFISNRMRIESESEKAERRKSESGYEVCQRKNSHL